MFKKLLDFLPSRLPTVKEEFQAFASDIFERYGYPDKPGYRQMIASMIMHFSNTTTHVPKRLFAKSIKKAQANELAYWVIQETNKEMAEEQERLKLEATNKDAEAAEPPKASGL